MSVIKKVMQLLNLFFSLEINFILEFRVPSIKMTNLNEALKCLSIKGYSEVFGLRSLRMREDLLVHFRHPMVHYGQLLVVENLILIKLRQFLVQRNAHFPALKLF